MIVHLYQRHLVLCEYLKTPMLCALSTIRKECRASSVKIKSDIRANLSVATTRTARKRTADTYSPRQKHGCPTLCMIWQKGWSPLAWTLSWLTILFRARAELRKESPCTILLAMHFHARLYEERRNQNPVWAVVWITTASYIVRSPNSLKMLFHECVRLKGATEKPSPRKLSLPIASSTALWVTS